MANDKKLLNKFLFSPANNVYVPGIPHKTSSHALSVFNNTGIAVMNYPLARAAMLMKSRGVHISDCGPFDKSNVVCGVGPLKGDSNITIAELHLSPLTLFIAAFDVKKAEFLFAGSSNDNGKTFAPFTVGQSPTADIVIWLLILDYITKSGLSSVTSLLDSIDESAFIAEAKAMMNATGTKPEFSKAIQNAIFHICDAVYYKMLGYNGADEIPLNLPTSGILPFVPDTLESGAYMVDTDLSWGSFTLPCIAPQTKKATQKAVDPETLFCSYALNENMSDEEKQSVPKMPEWYIVPKWVCKAAHNIKFHHENAVLDSAMKQNNIFLFGEPGTGKSEGAKAIASALGLPATHVSLSANSDEFVFTGQIIPDCDNGGDTFQNPFGNTQEMLEAFELSPDTAYEQLTGVYDENADLDMCMRAYAEMSSSKTSGVRYKFTETEFCKAVESGWLVTIEEFTNVRDAGIGIVLNQLMDGYQTITLPTGEVIHRHPNTVIVFASNVDEANCGEFEASQLSRLKPMYRIETPGATELINRVSKITGYTDEKDLSKMATVVLALRTYIKDHALVGICGVREFAGWVLQYLADKDFDENATLKEAALETIVPSASPHAEDIDDILRDVIDTML